MVRLTRVTSALLIGLSALWFHPAVAQSPDRIIVALDVSGSMRGAPLTAAVDATNRLLRELDSDTQLDIYIFNESISLIDAARSGELLETSSLTTLSSGGFTSLFDATWELVKIADAANAPLIILTDGNDSRSDLTQDELRNRLQSVAIPLYFIAFQSKATDLSAMNELAAATTGRVFDLNTIDQLASTFRTAVTSAQSKDREVSDQAPIVIAGAVGALALLSFNTFRIWRRREGGLSSWGELLDRYQFKSSNQSSDASSTRARNAIASRLIGDTSLIAPRITSQSIRESIVIGLILLFIALFTVAGSGLFFAFLASLLTTTLLLRALAARATFKIRKEFEVDLPGSLKLIAASLSAGLSFLQALDSFSQESTSCVAKEFRRALREIEMGVTVERALGEVAKRVKSEDLRWVVYAFSIQREVGGSLAKILRTSAETIDARANLRQEIQTLSAEGRISSHILMALPPTIFLFLLLTRPSFISILWEEPIGNAMLGAVIALMALAWLWIRRLIRQEA